MSTTPERIDNEQERSELRKKSSKNDKFTNIVYRPSLIYSMGFGMKMDQFRLLKHKYEEKDAIKEKKNEEKGKDLQNALQKAEGIRKMDFHKIDFDSLLKDLDTNLNTGLLESQVIDKIQKYGRNFLKEKEEWPAIVLWLSEMTGVFGIMLWIAAALCFICYGLSYNDFSNLFIAIVLCFIVIVSGSFSFYQNRKSTAVMAKFKNFLPPKAKVLREGKWTLLNASEIVPGDIVEISMGESIPADVRFFEVNSLKADQSSLTGESDEIPKKNIPTHDNVLETANVGFFGTKCTFGKGKGVVVNTGDKTIIGQIANLAQNAETAETTLSKDISKFVKIIAAVALIKGLIFFIIGLCLGISLINAFMYAVGIISADVPEGLVVTVTISLTRAAINMSKKQVLVKNLETIETLGSTSCICSDKTGTLTQAKMAASHMWVSNKIIDVSMNYQYYQVTSKSNPKLEKPKYDLNDPNFKKMVEFICLSTTADFDDQPEEDEILIAISEILHINKKELSQEEIDNNKQIGSKLALEKITSSLYLQRRIIGDSSEAGLIKFVAPIIDLNNFRSKNPINKANGMKSEISFNSVNKFNLIIRKIYDNNQQFHHFLLLMKGAPERILNRCNRIFINGKLNDYTSNTISELNQINDTFGGYGERVLAFAYLELDPQKYPENYPFDTQAEHKNFPMTDLIFYGLISMVDPPRPSVPDSVAKCRDAGIKVIMVTGDQPITAKAIAHKCNLITNLELDYDYLRKKLKMSKAEALKKCKSIVIHGDKLAKYNALNELKPDNDPEKDLYLATWLNIDEVVFARTSPSQKLLIVNGCQKIGKIVAVTGDGVNDSPAIKKADIGIAMGSGSDVAKDAADMILLNDDFSSIVLGIEEGRLIFDNLKKAVSYVMISNLPEMVPFIIYIIFQTPVAISSLLIIFIDVGTDLVPSFSFSYENQESNLMKRKPRVPTRDSLVGIKLMFFTYLQIGWIAGICGMYTYFCVMSDYGFKPHTLLFYSVQNNNCASIDWSSPINGNIDLRFFYKACGDSRGNLDLYYSEANTLGSISSVTSRPIRYTTEALRHAQTAYYISIIMCQISDALVLKTRYISITQQGFHNLWMMYGFITEFIVAILICYITFLNIVFGTRKLDLRHWFLPSAPFFILFFCYDEIRKLIMRYTNKTNQHGVVVEYGWLYRNTYY